MALEGLRSALAMITGVSEATRTRATEAAEGLLGLPGIGPTTAKAAQVTGQVSDLADEIVAAAAANRSMVADTVRAEVDLQLQRVGLTTTGGLTSAREEIDRLKAQVSDLRRALAARAPMAAPTKDETGTVGRQSRTTASRTASSATRSAAGSSTAKSTPSAAAAKTTGSKGSAVKKGAVKKSAVRRSAVKTTPAAAAATPTDAIVTQGNTRHLDAGQENIGESRPTVAEPTTPLTDPAGSSDTP